MTLHRLSDSRGRQHCSGWWRQPLAKAVTGADRRLGPGEENPKLLKAKNTARCGQHALSLRRHRNITRCRAVLNVVDAVAARLHEAAKRSMLNLRR